MNKKIFAANWKMYLNSNESREFMLKVNANKDLFSEFDIMIFPSHIAISIVQDLAKEFDNIKIGMQDCCLLYTSPSPRDRQKSRMPSSA